MHGLLFSRTLILAHLLQLPVWPLDPGNGQEDKDEAVTVAVAELAERVWAEDLWRKDGGSGLDTVE